MFNPLWLQTDLTRTMEPILEELARQLATPTVPLRTRHQVSFEASEEGWEARCTAPGVRPEELDVRAEDGSLHLVYKTAHGIEEGLDLHRKERRVGELRRKITIPRGADPETIHASLRHGVLKIGISRHASLTPKKIEVKEV